ncbi:MAG: alpha/beta hydrolase [Sphingomonadaceae bacterium]|nr:alpha/beta hydrolase [Sphingomonadaceae bacterium]
MDLHAITDWDDAYANAAHIADGDRWPDAWVAPARHWREACGARAMLDLPYGNAPRNRYDLFLPEGGPRGLVVFIHGGYWLALDKSYWSHLSRGPLARGFAVAMPSYTLCPESRIGGIVHEIGTAITAAAARIDGPIFITGHSAGGHLAARMVAAPSPLPREVAARVAHTVPISALADLRPLMRTEMNGTLRIDDAEAAAESPALLAPLPGTRVTCWVGADERPEFRRQSALLANIWTGLGAATARVEEPGRHHFNVIDGLEDPDHPLTQTLLGE